MQNTNKTLQGQSFLDIVIQETGSIENAVAMAFTNKRSLTTAIGIGQRFLKTPVTVPAVVAAFTQVNSRPSTGWTYNNTVPAPQEGISFWTINVDFEVTNPAETID